MSRPGIVVEYLRRVGVLAPPREPGEGADPS